MRVCQNHKTYGTSTTRLRPHDGGGCDQPQANFPQGKVAAFGQVCGELELFSRFHGIGFEFMVEAKRQVLHDYQLPR
jgi:hypothetical protein